MKANPSLGKSGKTDAASGGRRIMLVDDHPVMRNGLAQLIDQEPDLKVCGQYEDSPGAFSAIASPGELTPMNPRRWNFARFHLWHIHTLLCNLIGMI